MGKQSDILEYVLGESIGIGLQLRERNHDALNLAGSPKEVVFIVSDRGTKRKLVTLKLNDGITITDEPTAEALAIIEPERQRLLEAGVEYWYDLWTDTGSGLLHQSCGRFVLRSAVKP